MVPSNFLNLYDAISIYNASIFCKPNIKHKHIDTNLIHRGDSHKLEINIYFSGVNINE